MTKFIPNLPISNMIVKQVLHPEEQRSGQQSGTRGGQVFALLRGNKILLNIQNRPGFCNQ